MSSYHKLPAAEKRRVTTEAMRPPPERCDVCDTQVMPEDLLGHAQRCPGLRPPHPRDRWITWREARSMGVPKSTLNRWINRGTVRFRDREGAREYLQRDVFRERFRKRNRRGV